MISSNKDLINQTQANNAPIRAGPALDVHQNDCDELWGRVPRAWPLPLWVWASTPTSPLLSLACRRTYAASQPATTTPSPSLLRATSGPGAAIVNHSLAVPSSLLDTWNKPHKVEGLDQVSVLSAFASGVVSAVTGDDGSLWVWGKSKRGQLGLGKNIIEAVSPSRVEALLGHKIAKVSLGWGHALALTEGGKVFGWGYYADGRLGKMGKSFEASPLDSNEKSNLTIETAEKLVLEAIEKENDMPIIWEPTLIEELCDVEVVDVACGLDHSLVLCRDGTLLSGGSNVYGQLGRIKDDLGLHVVDMSFRPISISSGLGHSLAICKNTSSEDGTNVVTWGWNQSSQLGKDGPENVPEVVHGLIDETPVSVCGGRVHSIVVTDKGELCR
ncbi:hypothetical protein CASFOL_024504 [Castilleja foliolosa]|uniref:RCC1-like domain-containing protein n=1 Tax=Castilleja foliolosa TaxID=1961234 RepID=A0ABD3CNI6_9LAMI